jgi:hypothetical protein
MSTNIPSASHEVTADQQDMTGADAQDEFVGDDTVDDEAALDDSLEPADGDVLADDDDLLDDDDDDDNDDLLDDEDDDLLDDVLVDDEDDDDDL